MATMVEMDVALARGIWEAVAEHFNSEPDGATEEAWAEAAKEAGIPMSFVNEMREQRLPSWDELSPAHQALWANYAADSLGPVIAKSMKELLLVNISVVTIGTNGEGDHANAD